VACPLGGLNVVVAVDDDLSAQSDTTQLPSAGTVTVGVVWADDETPPGAAAANAATGAVLDVPRYAITLTSAFITAGAVTSTASPASLATATRW
jgi:hypothetical protein